MRCLYTSPISVLVKYFHVLLHLHSVAIIFDLQYMTYVIFSIIQSNEGEMKHECLRDWLVSKVRGGKVAPGLNYVPCHIDVSCV
jgi:hypothetical protein